MIKKETAPPDGREPGRRRRRGISSEIRAPLFTAAVIILLLLSSLIDLRLTRENENFAVILLQLLIFFLPSAAFLYLTGSSLSGLRIRPVGLGHLFLMLAALLAMLSSSIALDLTCAGYGSLSDSYDLFGIFVSKPDGTVGDGVYLVIAYAGLPAFCEEFLFRAVLTAEYEKKSTFAALVMPSLFFAMLHLDIAHFPALFISGLILSLTLYATRSVLAPFIVHFCYNLISLFGRPVFRTLYDLGGEKLFIFTVNAVFLLSGFLFCSEAARLYRGYSDKNLSSAYREAPARDEDSRAQTSVAKMFSAKYPRAAAALTALFSPTALAVYVLYAAAVIF